MSDKILGTVKWFSNRKGYGFITPKSDNSPTTEDIFVHQSSIHSDGYRTLNEGWEVEFEASPDDSGKLKAQNVTAPGGGPCTGPRLRRERKPREPGNDDEEGGAPENSDPQNGDNGRNTNRRMKPNGGRSNDGGGRTNNNTSTSNNNNNSGVPAANRVKKPQWHDVLDESVKQSLDAKSVRTTTGTVDVAMGEARVKLGTGGYASLAHATGLLAEGSFTCDEHGQVLLEWQKALQADADGNWNTTPVEENALLIKTFDLNDVHVAAVGDEETPESLWGEDKKDPKDSLEAN